MRSSLVSGLSVSALVGGLLVAIANPALAVPNPTSDTIGQISAVCGFVNEVGEISSDGEPVLIVTFEWERGEASTEETVLGLRDMYSPGILGTTLSPGTGAAGLGTCVRMVRTPPRFTPT